MVALPGTHSQSSRAVVFVRPRARPFVSRALSVVAIAGLLTVGCRGGNAPVSQQQTAPPAAADTVTPLVFAPALGVSLDSMIETSSGVYVQDLQTGRGSAAAAGKRVVVEYRAWLPDGTLYEERPNAAGWGPSEFLLGAGAPVPGLVDGIEGMRVGGVRRIVVPPERGYGLVDRPANVPAGSVLVFRVKLLAVQVD